MSEDEYRALLKKRGLTPFGSRTADLLECSMKTLANYANGKIPKRAASLIRLKLRGK